MSVEKVLCGGKSPDFGVLDRVNWGMCRNDDIVILGILSDKTAPAGVSRLEGRLNNPKESCVGEKLSAVGWQPLGDEGEARETPDSVGVEGDALSEFWTHGCEPVFMRACVYEPVC